MAIFYLYEPAYQRFGFFDDDGLTMESWLDRDLASTFIPLFTLDSADGTGVPLFQNVNTFFQPEPIEIDVFADFFSDPDTFFVPVAMSVLYQPDQMLKNEIIRIR